MKTVYLGGPDCFLPNAADIYAAKTKACLASGFEAKSPLDGRMPTPPPGITPPGISRLIYQANVETMRGCDFALFNLTPFRGASADAGTVYELGFMTGLGKPVFGYTNIAGDYIDRVTPRQAIPVTPAPPAESPWRDIDGWSIEDFGNADNLMIDSALALKRGSIFQMFRTPRI
jgi:nucleoside 2-deoxyribosyltransferase